MACFDIFPPLLGSCPHRDARIEPILAADSLHAEGNVEVESGNDRKFIDLEATSTIVESDGDGDSEATDDEEDTPINPFDILTSGFMVTPRLKDDILRFKGHFDHPEFGDLLSVEVALDTPTSGNWTIQDQVERIKLRCDGGRLIMFEEDGPTQFEGYFDTRRGLFRGEVIQDGVGGGHFDLQPLHAFPWVLPGRRRNMENHKHVEVVGIDGHGKQQEIASFRRKGLHTVGDVKLALRRRFGDESVANMKAVIRSNDMLATWMDEEKLMHARRVLVTGFCMPSV